MAASGPPLRRRGRRPRTYEAVLAATEQLLQTTPPAELSVAQILAAADVGRTSFYEHFSSKEDVVVRLVRRVSAELGQELAPLFQRGSRSPEEAIREGLGNVIAIAGSRHARLLRAAAEEWPRVPELRRIWFRAHGAATLRLAAMIDRDRAAGLAPPGADSQALAAALVWTAERAFHVALTGAHSALVDRTTLREPLVALFVGTIYGRPVAPEPDRPRSHPPSRRRAVP